MTTEPFKNFESRMAAVQTLYSYYIQTKDIEDSNTYKKTIQTKTSKKINKEFVLELVDTAIDNQERIDSVLQPHLTKHESPDRLILLLCTILRLAVAEQVFFGTPYKIVIDEYTKITSMFFDVEVKFANAILDKIFAGDNKAQK